MMTVLLVDDVALFLEKEKTFLESVGFSVATARSGEEALAKMEELSPDVVLLDFFLPGIGGDEVCRRLRADGRWRHLPIIMVTAAKGGAEVRRCLEAGCDDYLTKPVKKKDLMEKIRRLLGRVRGRTAERAATALNVQLKGGGKSLFASARDVSTEGIFVQTPDLLPPGTAVEMHLELPGGGQLPLFGKVRRVKEGAGGGMGIYFVHPHLQGREALSDLIEELRSAASAPIDPPRASDPRLRELEEENRRLHARILDLEEENREFAEQIVRTEEVNDRLTSLYVASSRLHSVLNREQVAQIIQEVVINFVAAEKFALLAVDRETGELRFEAGEGFEEEFPTLLAGEGIWREALEGEGSWFREGSLAAGSDDPALPIAAIPLRVHGRVMGVIAVYRLFVQKDFFDPADFQLFSMLAEHAATALFSSMLYQESERKRETYRGFMDLLLK